MAAATHVGAGGPTTPGKVYFRSGLSCARGAPMRMKRSCPIGRESSVSGSESGSQSQSAVQIDKTDCDSDTDVFGFLLLFSKQK